MYRMVRAPDRRGYAHPGGVHTFHPLGSALGLGIIVAVGASGVAAGASATAALTERVSAALTGGSVLLAVALVLVHVPVAGRLRARPRRTAAARVTEPVPTGAVADARA